MVAYPDRGEGNDPELFFFFFFFFFFRGVGSLSQPRLNIFTVCNMGVMICLGQGGLRSLSASSLYMYIFIRVYLFLYSYFFASLAEPDKAYIRFLIIVNTIEFETRVHPHVNCPLYQYTTDAELFLDWCQLIFNEIFTTTS